MIGLKGFIGAFFLLGSSVFLFGMGGNLTQIVYLRMTGVEAVGEVVELRRHLRRIRRRARYAPVARFRDDSGNAHEVQGRIRLGKRVFGDPRRATHDIGERVRVSYPSGRPEDARFTDNKTLFIYIGGTLFVLPFFALGVWLIRLDRRELKSDGWLE